MPVSPSTAAAVGLYVAAALLPGLAALRLLGLRVPDVTVRLGAAAGLGLALHPVVFLWARTLGLRLGPGAWAGLLLLAAAVAFWPARPRRAPRLDMDGDGAPAARGAPSGPPPESPAAARWAAVALAAVVVCALAGRWWAARAVTVPLWGDSVHHSLIAGLFVDHGGLVRDWRPAAPLATFTYHFGLHAGVAGLSWLSGLAPHRALVVAGQTLMALQAATVYALATGLTGRRWAGVGAALAATCLSPMPGYYINWGRYTQLAGQVVLPAAALLTLWAAGPPGAATPPAAARRLGAGAAASLAVAGLALTHYLVTPMFALLVAAWWLVGAAGVGARAAAGAAARLAGVALAAVAVAAPWIPSMAAGLLFETAAAVTAETLPDPAIYGARSAAAMRAALPAALVAHARAHVGWPLLAAAALGLAWAAARRARGGPTRPSLVGVGVLWTLLLVAAAYPWLVGLPFGAVLKDFAVAIALYLPLGLVVGGALGDALPRAEARWSRAPALAAALAAVAAATGAWRGRDVVDEAFRLVTPADERALAWIAGHAPPDARFLVSGFLAFGDTVAAGDDAGWWLPALAGRATTLPPITYGLERTFDPNFREAVNAVYARLPAGPQDEALDALLVARGVDWAYVGVTARALDGDALAASPRWRLVHADGGARVFARVAPGSAP